jgi:hypothetical protein
MNIKCADILDMLLLFGQREYFSSFKTQILCVRFGSDINYCVLLIADFRYISCESDCHSIFSIVIILHC